MTTGAMNERVGYVLKRAQLALRTTMDRALDANGVTTPQYAVLSGLEAERGISSAELARRAFVTPQTMIRIVENLELRGLIVREPHPTHGRVLKASLSPKGQRLVASCHQAVFDVEARMLAGLQAKERALLLEFLTRCADALDASK